MYVTPISPFLVFSKETFPRPTTNYHLLGYRHRLRNCAQDTKGKLEQRKKKFRCSTISDFPLIPSLSRSKRVSSPRSFLME